jgi:hypothetical protein
MSHIQDSHRNCQAAALSQPASLEKASTERNIASNLTQYFQILLRALASDTPASAATMALRHLAAWVRVASAAPQASTIPANLASQTNSLRPAVAASTRSLFTGHATAQQCSNTVFTGTADVHTDKSPDEVATDSNRQAARTLRIPHVAHFAYPCHQTVMPCVRGCI